MLPLRAVPLPRWGKVKNYDQPSRETGWVQTVEKPLTGFSDKFLQSAARIICAPAAHKFYTPQPEKYFLSGTRPDRK